MRRGRTPPLRTAWWLVRRADVGSELSAASGRGSEVSEWPRSKLGASAVRQRRNFGHRNRITPPYGGLQVVQGAGRCRHRPLRRGYMECGRRAVGEIGEALPVADEASRFRGSAPIGGHDSGRESVGTTVGNRRPLRKCILRCAGESFLYRKNDRPGTVVFY